MNYYLYLYTNRENRKRYIGTTMDLKRRCKDHARGYSSAKAFNGAVRKHGIDAFDFRVLAIFDNADEAARIEQAAIGAYKTMVPNGYNLSGGAPFTKYTGPHSLEHCQRISSSNKGRIVSPITRKKISDSLKAADLFANPERKKQLSKLNAANKGRIPWSKGKIFTPEYRQKMSAAHKGKPGHPISQETRQKISDAQKKFGLKDDELHPPFHPLAALALRRPPVGDRVRQVAAPRSTLAAEDAAPRLIR